MTEPRRKEWLFDRNDFEKLIFYHAENPPINNTLKIAVLNETIYSALSSFIQAEIERNQKDAVSEFANELKDILGGIPRVEEKIDAALKDRGIE